MIDYILYVVALAMTPGPNCIVSLENASRKGLPGCLTLNCGMATAQLLIDIVCYILINYLVRLIPKISLLLQILGILYIFYLAWCLLKKGKITIGNSSGTFKTGFLLQFVNVKAYLLIVTSLSTYVLPLSSDFTSGFVIMLILPAICISSHVIWAIAGAAMAKLYNKHTKLFNIIFAAVLIYQGITNIIRFFY